MDAWGVRLERIALGLGLVSFVLAIYGVFGPGTDSPPGMTGVVGLLVASLLYGAGAWMQTRAVHEAERPGGR